MVIIMGMSQKIKILLLKRGMQHKELAYKLGLSPTNLSNKLGRDNMTQKELQEIADILGCEYISVFKMKDTGDII